MQINVMANGLSADGFTAGGFVAISGEHAASDSDALTIRGAGARDAPLATAMTSPDDNIEIGSNADHISAGDLAYISDCSNGDIFRVSSVGGSTSAIRLGLPSSDNTHTSVSKSYSEQAGVSPFRTTRYYIADSDAATLVDGTPAPALWRAEESRLAELVQGIQNMQIQYGLDTDGDAMHTADAYQSATDVSDWDEVVSVRVAVLIQSLTLATDTADKTTEYQLLDQTVGPFNDRYLRRVFNFTVALRNRVH